MLASSLAAGSVGRCFLFRETITQRAKLCDVQIDVPTYELPSMCETRLVETRKTG